MARSIALIGAPSSAGAYAPGQEKAPAAFREHGLVPSLQQAGASIRDLGDVAPFRWRPDLARPKAMNLDAVQRTAESLAEHVAAAMKANEIALVLGGDCTIELGTVAGAQQDGASVGLVYIDFDVDLNPPEKSDGALDWTVAAHLLSLPGAAPELTGLASRLPMLASDDLLFFGSNEAEITPYEKSVIEKLSLEYISLAAVKENPVMAAQQARQWAARFDRLLIHLDTDVLSYIQFPIAENVRRSDGLTLAELTQILAVLTGAPNWRTLTITEANPDHAPNESEIFQQLIGALSSAIKFD
jgi:arginase